MELSTNDYSVKAKRDVAASMFRRYARLGLDRQEMRVFDAYRLIRGVSKGEKEAMELLGVYDMMRLLSLTDNESAEAVRAVYFAECGRAPKRSQTGMRVLRFAIDHSCDERTVYRRLKSAKELYYHLISNKFDKNT